MNAQMKKQKVEEFINNLKVDLSILTVTYLSKGQELLEAMNIEYIESQYKEGKFNHYWMTAEYLRDLYIEVIKLSKADSEIRYGVLKRGLQVLG